ncbi:calcium uptake protein 3, mitochondrial isoform X3 [Centruroides vittatus]|uniref:calcium uptake protein 3, mitochondrial isoform X3 n=1 Tax=Centruroides vittatus TaxID=120091 RepID=UPI00351064AE
MAAGRSHVRKLLHLISCSSREYVKNKYVYPVCIVSGTIGLGCALRYYIQPDKRNSLFTVHAKQSPRQGTYARQDANKVEESQTTHLTQRERRFIRFASVEYNGQIYMTPQDFLESVTESDPRPRMKRRKLSKKDLEHMYNTTPTRRKGSTILFRSLHENGIISYTEYLFLLSVLTKPHSGFRIAFNMFDTDCNQRIDKKEFLVLEKIFSKVAHKGHMLKRKEKGESIGKDEALDISDMDDTTLLIHLFGRKGNEDLSFRDFYRFMDNLQTEVLELEFTEFSRGMPTISEVDFAQILLRYTYIHSSDYEAYIQRVQERIPDEKGITFEQFKAFCQFLNNLDDFAIAMRMFTFANQPISQEEFHRAVKICTGHSLDSNLVNTVFEIFDEDGDGYLSYKEFIAIMRDRLHRGFRRPVQRKTNGSGSHLIKNEGWDAFKTCVKSEMRS